MKKYGFTIAEILITLGIVGVLGALTIPTLISSNRNKVFASSLSAAVSNFENAMNIMTMKDNANDLFGTKAWTELSTGNLGSSSTDSDIRKFMGNIGRVMPLAGYTKTTNTFYGNKIYELNSKTSIAPSEIWEFSGTVVFESKNGAAYLIKIPYSAKNPDPRTVSETTALNDGINLTARAAYVGIDVNGAQKPNMIGRDIFGFILGPDGILYPLGGDETLYIESGPENCSASDEGGLGCTEKLLADKYKMNY